jgi:hypothetical protein
MSNKPHAFKDRDVKRLLKVARDSGFDIARLEVNPRTGAIALVRKSVENGNDNGELDAWMTNHADQSDGR